ncbi:polyphosphate polymerase domain-containing protein [Stieleria marina]|uniref:polyphosphate polymerase domain-containing protein n=1 Tax=Stieleria marina TaxID=1930275 RepID=UPI003AF39BCD
MQPTAAIDAWDEGTTRQDLAVRKELKFTFDRGDVGAIRQVLQQRCKRIVHHEPVSWVRSVYFDNESFAACHANLDGLGVRTKVRLRWYDSLQPKRKAYLEIKWRRNRTTGKHRLHLTSPIDLAELNFRTLRRSIRASLPERFVGAFAGYPQPVSIVQYCREHFVTPDRSIRLTMDYALTFYDQFSKSRINTSFPATMGDFVVVEGKTAVGSEQQLRRLLSPLAVRASRCSKYVHSCRLLGLVRCGE